MIDLMMDSWTLALLYGAAKLEQFRPWLDMMDG